MGVNGLWSLLTDIKQDVHLSKCSGKKLAVDLSSWLVACGQVGCGPSKDYLRYRSVFFRTLNLLSLGVTPVFVKDSKDAPPSKKRQRGNAFFYLVEEYQVMLKALGVPVIQSPGEAEKTCAELNRREIVDGCLTNDGDVLVYGAKTIYKGLASERQDIVCEKYEMTDIENQLGLNRNDLVAFALLSGSDMCDGIHGVGGSKFMELVHELHRNGITDILERMRCWRTGEPLLQLEGKSEELKSLPKGVHCSQCSHEGTIQRHKRNGCHVCSTQENCVRVETAMPSLSCPCAHHVLEASVKPFQVELKIRNSAIKTTDFPSQTVIDEYLDNELGDNDPLELTLKLPDFRTICDITARKLNLTSNQTFSHLIPAIIRLHLHGCLILRDLQPLEIIKTKIINKDQYYVVKWKPLPELQEFDVNENCYQIDVSQDLFKSKFGDMAQAFTDKKTSPQKRKQIKDSTEGHKQLKITDMFQVRKNVTVKDLPSKS